MGLFGRKKLPGANKNNHFYLRDAAAEGLNRPVHIHFDSYKPALMMGNKSLPNPCTFLVTVDSDEFGPRGLTCRVSGVNHKLTFEGVKDGVLAVVKMARYEDDGSVNRVYVQLLEDGRVVGQLVANGRSERISDLSGVSFMSGDSVFLNGMGEPLDSDDQPSATKEQQLLLERENEGMINSILDSLQVSAQ